MSADLVSGEGPSWFVDGHLAWKRKWGEREEGRERMFSVSSYKDPEPCSLEPYTDYPIYL